MKLHFAAAASAALLASVFALPVQASPIMVGQVAADACSQAAIARLAHKYIGSDFSYALLTCRDALNGQLSANDRAATLSNRGILEASAGMKDAAVADFRAALALNPDLKSAHIELARFNTGLVAQNR